MESSRYEATVWKPLVDFLKGVADTYEAALKRGKNRVVDPREPTVVTASLPSYTLERIFHPQYLQETAIGAYRAAYAITYRGLTSDFCCFPRLPIVMNLHTAFNINWVVLLYLRQIHKYRYDQFVAGLTWKEWKKVQKTGEGLVGRGKRFESRTDLDEYLDEKNPFFRADERRDLYFYVQTLLDEKVRPLAWIVEYVLSFEFGDGNFIRWLNDRGFLDGNMEGMEAEEIYTPTY